MITIHPLHILSLWRGGGGGVFFFFVVFFILYLCFFFWGKSFFFFFLFFLNLQRLLVFVYEGVVGGSCLVMMDTFLIVNYECLLEDTTILIVLRLVYNVVSMNVKYVIVMVVYVTYIYMVP